MNVKLALLTALALTGAAAQAQDRFLQCGAGGPVKDPYGSCVLTLGGTNFPECGGVVEVAAPESAPIVESGPLFASLGADANFDFDRSELRPDGQRNLDRLVADMNQPGLTVNSIEIVGHTDSKGTEEYNQGLSERRAASAANYLIDQGVSPGIITTEGRGELQPIATNTTEEGRARNRRVDITVDAERVR